MAFLIDGKFSLIVALQTTMKFWLESQPLKVTDERWMAEFGRPILAMEEFILNNAPLMHANSRAIVRDIREKYGLALAEERLFYSPHGMEDWLESMGAPIPHPDETRILFVGRLESRKGIDILLEAAPGILKKYPNAVLDIVGDDTILRPDGTTYKSEFLKQRISPEISDRIRFHGRVEEEALRSFYHNCDVFVGPSRYESFGLVFLEALVFGKPVIASNAGGAPEVVTHMKTGLIVSPGDTEELSGALDTLLSNGALRSRMGKAARQDYEERFTDQVMVKDFLKAFTRMGIRADTSLGGSAKKKAGNISDM